MLFVSDLDKRLYKTFTQYTTFITFTSNAACYNFMTTIECHTALEPLTMN